MVMQISGRTAVERQKQSHSVLSKACITASRTNASKDYPPRPSGLSSTVRFKSHLSGSTSQVIWSSTPHRVWQRAEPPPIFFRAWGHKKSMDYHPMPDPNSSSPIKPSAELLPSDMGECEGSKTRACAPRGEKGRGPGYTEGWATGPRGCRERVGCTDMTSTPPASCPAFLGRRKANHRPTSGCTVTSEAGLGPVTIWVGGQPDVRQEGVTLAQWLQLLALTQRGPWAVLRAQRGLGCCGAGTHTHIQRETCR